MAYYNLLSIKLQHLSPLTITLCYSVVLDDLVIKFNGGRKVGDGWGEGGLDSSRADFRYAQLSKGIQAKYTDQFLRLQTSCERYTSHMSYTS